MNYLLLGITLNIPTYHSHFAVIRLVSMGCQLNMVENRPLALGCPWRATLGLVPLFGCLVASSGAPIVKAPLPPISYKRFHGRLYY